ncbi:MAG: DUF456 family protein [Anaerohalosphaeraceae bacterium]|nr:DUF456 family protein [Anaerohalosphaeraceae bacterium]
MIYFWLTLLLIINALWLGLVLFALPGNWLMIIMTVIFAWWQGGTFSGYTIALIIILAIIGEIIEFVAGAGGAKRAGAGWKGAMAAIAGAIVGAIWGTFLIPIPIFGTLAGACIGAGIGAGSVEKIAGAQMKSSINVGLGAGIGQFLGIGGKFAIGIIIWLIIAIAAFF